MIQRQLLLGQIIAFIIFSYGITYSQTADFTVDINEGCNPLTVNFTNMGSTGTDYTYHWDFGGVGSSNEENPTYTFANPYFVGDIISDYKITFKVTNKNTLVSDSITKTILVKQTPSANLEIDSANACVNGDIEFYTGSSKDSAIWDFGDDSFGYDHISQYVYHSYQSNGTYNMKFITFLEECSETKTYSVTVDGPIADFSTSQYEACINDSISFDIAASPIGVTSLYWNFDGKTIPNQNSVSYAYDSSGYHVAQLHISGPAGNCMIDDTVNIIKLIASFTFNENRFCEHQLISMQSTSVGNDYNFWDFGSGKTAIGRNVADSFPVGTHTIKLRVANDLGCSDSTQKQIVVKELPTLQLNSDTTICGGKAIKLNVVSNANAITWYPTAGLNNPALFSPLTTLDSSITYYITVTDTSTKCRQYGQMHIIVQDQINFEDVAIIPNDTTICGGKPIHLNAISDGHEIIWSPIIGLSNPNIFNPSATLDSSITYYITVTDTSTNCHQYGQLNIIVQDHITTDPVKIVPYDTTICGGKPIQLNAISNGHEIVWSPIIGLSDPKIFNPSASPDSSITYYVTVTDTNTNCHQYGQLNIIVQDHITNDPVKIVPYDTTICGGKPIQLNAISNGHEIVWSPIVGLNNPNIFNPSATLDSSITYYVTVTDTSTNCHQYGQLNIIVTDQISADTVIVTPIDTTICSGSPLQLNAIYPGHIITWVPATWLNNPNIFNPVASPISPITYKVTVIDTNTYCRQYGQLYINIVERNPTENIFVFPEEDTIFKGDVIQLVAIDNDSILRNLNFKWRPSEYIINCANCKNPLVRPLVTTTFVLEVKDTITCYSSIQLEAIINVIEKYIIGVPDAFTPNAGDEINKTIKVDGKGIEEFIEFRIYNRWGTEVFYTDDMVIGWDGYYKGKLQNVDSYAYIIKAKMYDGNIVTKKGTFSLIR
jgi:gliding motility-associated-like protein